MLAPYNCSGKTRFVRFYAPIKWFDKIQKTTACKRELIASFNRVYTVVINERLLLLLSLRNVIRSTMSFKPKMESFDIFSFGLENCCVIHYVFVCPRNPPIFDSNSMAVLFSKPIISEKVSAAYALLFDTLKKFCVILC